MSKNLEMCQLLDLYGSLLTDKQYDIMDLYYNDDLSLGEIADEYSISRQGVHDAIKRGEESVREYEEKLGLLRAQKSYRDEILGIKKLALDVLDECNAHISFRAAAEKTVTLLECLDSKLNDYDNTSLIEREEKAGG